MTATWSGFRSPVAGHIERYLANRPILAHPPSTAYQIRKLVSRHRFRTRRERDRRWLFRSQFARSDLALWVGSTKRRRGIHFRRMPMC